MSGSVRKIRLPCGAGCHPAAGLFAPPAPRRGKAVAHIFVGGYKWRL